MLQELLNNYDQLSRKLYRTQEEQEQLNNTIQQLPTAASEQYTEFIIQSDDTDSVLFINVKHIIFILISVAVLISIIFGFFSWISDYKFLDVRRQKRSKMNKKAKKNRGKGPHFSSSRFINSIFHSKYLRSFKPSLNS